MGPSQAQLTTQDRSPSTRTALHLGLCSECEKTRPPQTQRPDGAAGPGQTLKDPRGRHLAGPCAAGVCLGPALFRPVDGPVAPRSCPRIRRQDEMHRSQDTRGSPVPSTRAVTQLLPCTKVSETSRPEGRLGWTRDMRGTCSKAGLQPCPMTALRARPRQGGAAGPAGPWRPGGLETEAP